jgi:hypothetical protein
VEAKRHGASGSASGYLYQCERALLELISRASVQPGLTLFMEKLDDVHLAENGHPVEILQIKHHTGPGGNLTDDSQDLWRTLDVWIDVLPKLDADDAPEFAILTTSHAPEGSAASLLRSEDRDSERALRLLLAVADNSTSKTTASARGRFKSLGLEGQTRIVSAMVVRDAEPPIQDLDDQLKGLIRIGVRPEHQDGFIESLKGWWYARSVALLRGSETAVAVNDLLNKIHDLRDSYQPENLPYDYDVGDPTEAEQDSYATRLFIQQLRWIAASNDLLRVAIDEYHRAFANRSRWLRLGLLRPGELDEYEQKLVIEWKRQHAFMRAGLGSTPTEEESQRAGLDLWRSVSDSSAVRIRERFHEQTLTRGTYHDLADRKQLGWHPLFADRIRQLLEQAV